MSTDLSTKNLQISLPVQADPRIERLLGWVADPADINALARDALAVFVVHAEQAVQRLTLTEPEVGALLSVVDDLYIEPRWAHHFAVEVAEALERGLDEEWDINGNSLLWRIEALHPFEAAALAMTLEAALDVQERYEGNPIAAARSLGLLPTDR